jgi:CSLREA domain-containing protein
MNKIKQVIIPIVTSGLLLGLLYFVVGQGRASAIDTSFVNQGTILVTTLDDELNTDSDCSLREAIEAANTNTVVDGCSSGDVLTDTITFDVAGTITLNNSLVVQSGGPIIIDGSDVVSISGGGVTNILLVEPGSNLTLQNLVMQNGHNVGNFASGLTNNFGNVTIIKCEFSGNITNEWLGGAIYNQGMLNISTSTFYSNTVWWDPGGGLCNDGVASITDSTFSDNQGYIGGGIENTGVITITNSTISGNSTFWYGGGLYNTGVASIINSSISLNSVGQGSGGGISNTGIMSIVNSTVSSNSAPTGGGIRGEDTVFLANTIIANNQMGGDCIGTIADNGHNLDSDGSCGLDAAKGSLLNTDPLLGPLQDNGGPTLTHALLWGSPAIDASANEGCPATDQRGVTRPVDGNRDGLAVCDIGSFEFNQTEISFLPIVLKHH